MLKLYPQCIVCQINVRYRDLEKAKDLDTQARLHIMRGVLDVTQNFLEACLSGKGSCVPTELATKLFRYIKSALNNPDPYFEDKVQAHKEALKLYEAAKEVVFSEMGLRARLYRALQFSLVSNLLDMGVANYNSPKVEDVVKKAQAMQIHGSVDEALDLLLRSRSVAMILDNAGESVFDRLVADVLKASGVRVYAVVKRGAFQNDVTIADAQFAMLSKSFDEVYDTGTDASSIFLSELGEKARALIKGCDVILSKGMANYEYITEVASILSKPIIYALAAKCLPVSIDTGIPLNEAGIRIYIP
jgi:uncharacterized protein with ATP-grasp and redox domains